MIKVYVMEISAWIEKGLPGMVEEHLSPYRRERMARCQGAEARCQGAASELLLREALRGEGILAPLAWSWEQGEDGKPWIRELPEVCFNLSHSGPYVACAISKQAVGVDIQCITPGRLRIAQKYFCPQEWRRVEMSSEKDCLFCQLWTGKEAYLKMSGTGIRRPLSSFWLNEETGCVEDLWEPQEKTHLFTATIDDSACLSVCSKEKMDGTWIRCSASKII